MARYQTGTASDIQDLMSKLESFLTNESPGFVIDRSVTAQSPFSLAVNDGGNGFWQFEVHTSLADHLTINQSTSFDGSASGGNPGSCFTSSGAACLVDFTSTGPYENYFFYGNFDPTLGPMYCHCVVEVSANRFRHFGFGNIDKFGAYTGGEYHYGHFWDDSGTTAFDWQSGNHHILWDNAPGNGNTQSAFSMRLIGTSLSGYNRALTSPAQKWLGARSAFSTGFTDGDGVQKFTGLGGVRSRFYTHFLKNGGGSQFNGFLPFTPIPVFMIDYEATPDEMYLIGYPRHQRVVNMEDVAPKQSLTRGGDTWDIYPLGIKETATVSGQEATNYCGIAYQRF